MANLNRVFLIGRLTRDPELRYTQNGTAVAEFGLAINRNYTTSSGEKREETTFVDVIVWQRKAELICEYMSKGRTIFVEGRLELDKWETQDGQKRSKLRVVADNFQFLGGPGRGGAAGGGGAGGARPAAGGRGSAPEDFGDDVGPGGMDDDIPF